MKMYLWKSEALRAYGDGYIIACGETEDEARKAALGQFLSTYGDESFSPLEVHNYEAEALLSWADEEDVDSDRIEDTYNLFVSDLRDDPTLVVPCETGAYLIDGSD